MMFYEKILRALQRREVRYLILGGAAVNLHGVPRMTGDLDLAVDLSPENVNSLIMAMKDEGLHINLPVDPAGLSDMEQRRAWREEKHLEALTFQSDGKAGRYLEVDIVLDPPIDFERMFEERVELKVDDLSVSLISLGHLIEIKRDLGREQDLADVEALEKTRESGEGGENA